MDSRIYYANLNVIQAWINLIAEIGCFRMNGLPWSGSHPGQQRKHDAEIIFNGMYITLDPTTAGILGGFDDMWKFSVAWYKLNQELEEGVNRRPVSSCD